VSGPSAVVKVVVDTTAPDAPVITAPADGSVTNNAKLVIAGTGEAGATVTVTDGTDVLGTAKVDADGKWSLTPAGGLADGKRSFTATQRDEAGNVSAVSAMVTVTVEVSAKKPVPTAPVITAPADGLVTNNAKVVIAGTGEAGATVTVTDGTAVLGTAKVDDNGHWSLELAGGLADGGHGLAATQKDVAGNVSGPSAAVKITVDTVVAAPVILVPADGASVNAARPVIAGTGEPGATVTVTDGTDVLGTAKVDADGKWSLTPAGGLADGKHSLTATQIDVAGNVSGPSPAVTITVGAAAPGAVPKCGGRAATIVGTAGNDVLVGTPGRDVIWAGPGNDIVKGRGGGDIVCGGAGNDKLIGGSGNDKLFGGPGNDIIKTG
jgi:hypothetical protein